MLTKIQTKIQTKVDELVTAKTPVHDWNLLQGKVHIEHSINRPCFKVVFGPAPFEKPASDASAAVKKKYEKFKADRSKVPGIVHAIVFELTTIHKDLYELKNDAGAGLELSKIEPLTSSSYAGFAVTLTAKDLTKEVYNALK